MLTVNSRRWKTAVVSFLVAAVVSFFVTVSLARAEARNLCLDYGESGQSNYYFGGALIYAMYGYTETNCWPSGADAWSRGFNNSGATGWHMVGNQQCIPGISGNGQCWASADMDSSQNNPPSSGRYGTTRHARTYWWGTNYSARHEG